MKKLFIIFSFLILSAGCQEDNLPMSEIVGEWKLIKSHQYVGTEVIREGDDLEWQETYVFRANGTFQKSRTSPVGMVSATGKFTTEEGPLYLARPVKLLITLSYNTAKDLAVGCSPGKEEIEISSHDGLLRNYSIGCEKPIFSYQKQ
ncbi:MAG TPA: hypothetical protein VK921_17120 [Anditalea sp.]|nr:hypothetical protein [Anditalea sp.]